MNPLLNENLFLIKQHIGMFKAANNFDIYNPETSEIIINCREDQLGFFTKMFRFSKYKAFTPFHVEIKSINGDPIFSLKRGASFFGFTPIPILNENNIQIGKLTRKFRLGGAKIDIVDNSNKVIATLSGNLIGWDFKIKNENVELASITKKWSGLGKELFTSADNYILVINENVLKDDPIRPFLLCSVFCIDFLLKNQ